VVVVPGFGLRAIIHDACYKVAPSHDNVLFPSLNNLDDDNVFPIPSLQSTMIHRLICTVLPDILPYELVTLKGVLSSSVPILNSVDKEVLGVWIVHLVKYQ
jgi:hypothetical protein